MENEINIDKIIEKSKQWTLEGDCTLLQWMNQISNNLEERVTKTSSAINQMSTKLDRTSIALSNVTNNLAALQYSKFVENRVHEDDETLPNTTNVPSEDVTDKKNLGQDIYSFLKKNVEMMNSCHEAYSISYEDSDDDDEPVTSVVYRSKNPYESRPLPHIYGSNQWKEKWHIGLCDSDDNDFSGEENSEQFSESSSTADDSYESTAQTISEWDSTAWGLNTQHNNVERKNMHTPSNDGESSYQGENYNQSKVSTPRTQRHVPIAQQLPIQDQRYYQHVPRRQESLFDDIFDDSKPQEVAASIVSPQVIPRQVVSAPQTKIIPESYIPNEPPPDEQSIESESNRRPGAKKTLNLFDDDEFSSFMDQIVQKATNKNIKPNETPQDNPESSKKAATKNDFNDNFPPDNDSQRQPKKDLAPNLIDESNVQKQKQPSKTLDSNIFNEPDDLFKPTSDKTQEPPKKIIAQNLFSDSDDLFAPSIREQPIVKRKSSSPPKLEDDIFTASPKPVAIIGKTKIKNLFDDDDEDDDFDNIFSSKPSSSKTFSQATKNLFSDDLAVEPEIKEATLENDKSIREVPATSSGFFEDEQNRIVMDNEKADKTPLLKENLAVQKNLFGDDDDISSIFEKEEVPSGTPVLKDTLKDSSLLKKGLFDDFDELEDENDIFSTKPAKKDPFENIFQKDKSDNKLSTAILSKTLFGDEDEKDEDTKIIESKKSEVVEQNFKNKPSDSENISNIVSVSDALTKEPPLDIFASSSSSIQKTQVADMFADDVPDDFENSSKLCQGTEEYSEIPESPKKVNATEKLLVTESNPTEPTISPESTPRLAPIIAQKPLVDKSSKPQSKVVSKNNFKAGLSEKPQDENDTTATKRKTEQISASYSEDPHPDLSKLNAPQLSETPKTQIHSVSKLDSTLDMNVSESSKDFKTKKVQIEDGQKNVEEENTQRHMVEEGLKPIPKPKPKVIIEDEKIFSPSKNESVENSLAEQSVKKPSTIPSYTSLFHDDFPPEDENPNPASNGESPLHTVEEDVDVKKPIPSSSSVPYSSINLFADVPPDDYLSESSTPPATPASQTKRIHSIFYDDFNETIEAGREMRTPSNYMINDEPPPDDEKVNKPIISDVVQKEKPKVSKLKKMDFQINVGALLPSAKLPSFKKPEVIKKSQSEISIKEPNITSSEKPDFVPSHLASAKTRDLPENVLPNLNRDRAKVQVKRRPSTRRGRQERYRNSMIEDTVSIANPEQNEIETTKSMSSSLFENFKTGIQENQEISKGKVEIKEQMITPVPSSSFEEFGTFDKKLQIIKESKGDLNKMPDQATLFEESDNLFNKHIVTSNSSSKATKTKIPSLFTNSDSELENIFETIKTVKSNTKKVELDPPPMTKNLDSLFDSDGIDENPFGTPKNFLPPPSSSFNPKETATNKPVEDKSKLDLLFESVQQKESKGQPTGTAFKPSDEPAKPTPKSLFGDDSDDSSDDLFKGASVSKKAVSQQKPENKPKTKLLSKPAKQPSASLFSSDEGSGSGEDIFGKAKSKTSVKKNESIKDNTASNLFANLSDDDSDGLFGMSTKKTIGVNKSKTNPPKARVQSTKQPAQAQPAKAISSNPLSDLLGP